MAGWMPILRQHHVLEPRGQPIDHRHDLIAARNREASFGTEVVLDVDNQKDVLVADRKLCGHAGTLSCAAKRLSCCAKRLSTSLASRTNASATCTGYDPCGSSRRNGSGSRARSHAARARISASVGDSPMRRPPRMTNWISGSPVWSSLSIDRISPTIRPSDPYRRQTCLRPGHVAFPVERLRRGSPPYSCSL